MTNLEFERLVKRLEASAASDPTGYRRRVSLMAYAGIVYIILVAVVMLLLCGALSYYVYHVFTYGGRFHIAIPLFAIVCAVSAFLSVKAIFFRLTPPTGRRLTVEEAPALHADVARIASLLGARPPDEIIITPDFNAAAVETPRFGFFGRYTQTLILGLPLLHQLSGEELRSVIAHEFGHFTEGDSRHGIGVYRVRESYSRLYSSGNGGPMFNWFLNHYWPRFNAYSFTLMRQQEYAADRAAARVTSPQIASSALVRISMLDYAINKHFWKDISQAAKLSAEPLSDVYTRLRNFTPPVEHDEDGSLKAWKELSELRTGYVDTHPCTLDRVRALQVEVPEDWKNYRAVEQSAAAEYLAKEVEERILTEFNSEWEKNVKEAWKWQHEEMQRQEKVRGERLGETDAASTELDEQIAAMTDVDLLTERAVLALSTEDTEEAIKCYQRIVEIDPRNPDAQYDYACGLLLYRKDMAALDIFRRIAPMLYPDIIANMSNMGENALMYFQRPAEADAWVREMRGEQTAAAKREEKRAKFRRKSVLKSHGIPEERIREIAEKLHANGVVKRLWMAQKVLAEDENPERPALVFWMERKSKLVEDNRIQGDFEALFAAAPKSGIFLLSSMIYPLQNSVFGDRCIVKRLKKMEGALIYDRKTYQG